MAEQGQLAILEPWFGESHLALFSGVAEHSGLACTMVTLKPRRWRWRMRLGAWHLARQLDRLDPRPQALLVSDYVNLPLLQAFSPSAAQTPTAIYFLENQLTYPLRQGDRPDFEFVAINFLSCLAADRCVFCSAHQLEAFLSALPGFLRRDADCPTEVAVQEIRDKSQVIPIGVDLARFDRAREQRPDRTGKPLRLVWPHRFEHDKNPDDFFQVLVDLASEKLDFEVAAIGRNYRDLPPSMAAARECLGSRIVEWGFLEGEEYAGALADSDVVVSTAWQETQGIAVIEAIRAGCDPLLPDRLSYPEVLGPDLAANHLYPSKGELRRRLRWMARNPDLLRAKPDHWSQMQRFGWREVGPQFTQLYGELVRGKAELSSPGA